MSDTLPVGQQKAKKGRKPKRPSVFAKNLKKIMAEKKMNIRELSRQLGIANSVLHGWVNGVTPNDPEIVLRLCQVLGADFQFMMTGTPSSNLTPDRLDELFQMEDTPEFSGIYLLEAKKLRWRKNK